MSNGRKPDYRVYVTQVKVVKGQGATNFYKEVGAAWNVEKEGISIKLHALPVDGSLVLFPPREKVDEDTTNGT